MRHNFTRFTVALCLLLPAAIAAQPLPCGTPAAMTPTCAPACVVCDINGFTGRNNSTVTGQAPPGFCTTFVHHMQWIAFIAGSTNLTLRVDVFGCQQGQGLEIGIYQTANCQTFALVSNCNTNVPNNTFATFTNTVPLVIGQHYYFVMDGSANDICNYTVTVVTGSTQVPPLTASGSIEGPATVCPGASASFSSAGVAGATLYNWTLNGATAGTGLALDTNFPTAPGMYQLCLTAANACSTAPPVCRTVAVPGIPVTDRFAAICPGECVTIADTTICNPGMYERRFLSAAGCDSLVRITVTAAPEVLTDLDLFICEGDTLSVGGNPYFTSGQFVETLSAANGCDSTVQLALVVVICEIQAEITARPVSCRGDTDGRLIFGVTEGTPPFTYTWNRIGQATPAGQGALATLSRRDTLSGLPPGQYIVVIEDLFGNNVVLLAEITEPPVLELSVVLSDYNGFAVSCRDGADGTVQVSPSGGTAPYSFLWNTGATGSAISGVPAGQYAFTFTDANGCAIARTLDLTQPEALTLSAAFDDPGCDGPATGAVRAEIIVGGVAPYLFALQGGAFGPDDVFAGLPEGPYELTARDANGCTVSQSDVLTAVAIPQVDLGPDLMLDLGERIRLNAIVNMPLLQAAWLPPDGLSCADCPNPEVMPVRTTTYTFGGFSADGCYGADSVTVLVLRIRDVFVPNAFSPNADGVNDRFTVFGGPEVAHIRVFRVFSRWGELVFEQKNFPANSLNLGWDGVFRGKPMGQGAFAWQAEIEFIDGVIGFYEGNVTLLR
jgi:gliding motility-associated-like protein